MCDSVAVVADGEVWLAKNSDREPGEAQAVEHHPAAAAAGTSHARRRCTHVTVADVGPRRAVVLSRPSWMWGAEMGINERGLAIANEAVFTRMPVADAGLTGMDLLRLALERADTAREALDVITGLLREHPQGGRMGHRAVGFRYHSSFLVADGTEAWQLETAGWLWAARRVQGVCSISNVLSIGTDFDRIHPEAVAHARAQGWGPARGDFDFARAFGDPLLKVATGGATRRACTRREAERPGDPFERLAAALRSHGGARPASGWRMQMPCAHASWLPTRTAGQTTGSMIARTGPAARAWITGTSSPCLSVFKPVALDRDTVGELGRAAEAPDDRLWWTHERFHRAVLMGGYEALHGIGLDERAALEARARRVEDPSQFAALWREHHEPLLRWSAEAEGRSRGGARPFVRFWRGQTARDGLALPSPRGRSS